jgi:hypothetical protein
MGLPAIVVVAGIVTLVIAVKSDDGVVSDDYYKQGLAVNQVIDRDIAAQKMGLQANLMRNGTAIRVIVSAKPEVVLPEVIRLRLAHPTRSGMDQEIDLTRDVQGGSSYGGQLQNAQLQLSDHWNVFLEDQAQNWRLKGNWKSSQESPLQLLSHQ